MLSNDKFSANEGILMVSKPGKPGKFEQIVSEI
jgi:hypothetical protein